SVSSTSFPRSRCRSTTRNGPVPRSRLTFSPRSSTSFSASRCRAIAGAWSASARPSSTSERKRLLLAQCLDERPQRSRVGSPAQPLHGSLGGRRDDGVPAPLLARMAVRHVHFNDGEGHGLDGIVQRDAVLREAPWI